MLTVFVFCRTESEPHRGGRTHTFTAEQETEIVRGFYTEEEAEEEEEEEDKKKEEGCNVLCVYRNQTFFAAYLCAVLCLTMKKVGLH